MFVKQCQQLSWVKKQEYVYDVKRRHWLAGPHLIAGGISIPSSRRWPNWLFRGDNACYDAFHDVTRILKARSLTKRAQQLETHFQKQPSFQECAKEDSHSLHHGFTVIQNEHARIVRLRKKLMPVIRPNLEAQKAKEAAAEKKAAQLEMRRRARRMRIEVRNARRSPCRSQRR